MSLGGHNETRAKTISIAELLKMFSIETKSVKWIERAPRKLIKR